MAHLNGHGKVFAGGEDLKQNPPPHLHVVEAVGDVDHGLVIETPQPAHKPKLGCTIRLLVAMSVISGFLLGYDTGVISASMLYIPRNEAMKPLGTIWHQMIVAFTPGMAGIGALFCGILKLPDRLGRRRVINISTSIFTAGAIICAIGLSKGILLTGRMLLGLAIGISASTIPAYVSECSPAHIRGTLVTAYEWFDTLGILTSYSTCALFSYWDPVHIGWRMMVGIAAIPAIVQFTGFLFLPESPRWLYTHKGREACAHTLRRIYHGDEEWIDYELEVIKFNYVQKVEDEKRGAEKSVWLRIFKTPTVRWALCIGCLLQVAQQFSGINTIMYYTDTIIRAAGVHNEHTVIWISVGIGFVNFMMTLVPILFVEKLGRRLLFLCSQAGVVVACLLISLAFLAVNLDSAKVVGHAQLREPDQMGINASTPNYAFCSSFSNCDYCTTSEACGFCQPSSDGGHVHGYCLPKDGVDGERLSATGPCAGQPEGQSEFHAFKGVEFEWSDRKCYSTYTFLPIVAMILFICAFSPGLAPLTWVLNAEFYPLWARGTCVSITTSVNFLFNLLVSLTFLSLNEALSKAGTFGLYCCLSFLLLVFFFVTLPETKGLNLEEIQSLFLHWRYRAKTREEMKREKEANQKQLEMARR